MGMAPACRRVGLSGLPESGSYTAAPKGYCIHVYKEIIIEVEDDFGKFIRGPSGEAFRAHQVFVEEEKCFDDDDEESFQSWVARLSAEIKGMKALAAKRKEVNDSK